MSTPEQPAPPVAPVPQQLAVGLVDTVQGQRLAVTVTLLLDADGAKALAAAISAAAAGMSASGLVVAGGGVLNGNGGRM